MGLPEYHTGGSPPDRELAASGQQVLDGEIPLQRWPARLREAFDASIAERQFRDHRFLLRLGLAVLLVTTPMDWVLIPDHAEQMLALRLGLVLPLQALGLLLPARMLPLQKLVTGLSVIAFAAVLMIGVRWASPVVGAYMAIGPVLVIGMMSPVLSWRSRAIVAFLLACAAVALTLGLWVGGTLVREPAFIAVYFATGVVAYFLQQRVRGLLARNFLLALQSEVRLAELAHSNARLVELSMQDPLTGLANRRRTTETFARQYDAAPATGEARAAVMMVDLDHFKDFNDSWGHHAGDDCLRAVAEELRHCAASHGGLAARFGGEEFVIVLRVDSDRQARELAEDLRMAIEQIEIPHGSSGRTATCTASIGIAVHDGRGVPELSDLLQRADAALYAAKDGGRNRSELAPGAAPAGAAPAGPKPTPNPNRRVMR